ncbi:MAG: sugar ABC transporter ATP-binding protein [Oscillospiraceae bacterium]|nr:sugar ABC transporter ATP-binding protein [Oscillospiraceae bacterium]
MFEVVGINKHFDAVVALNNVSMKVAPGEIKALLGSNGSGKSTLIKVLAGLVYPNAGSILIDGHKVSINSGYDALKLGIVTAFQDLSSVPAMTVMDNIMLGRENARPFGIIDKQKALEEVNGLLRLFELECHPDDFVQALIPSTQSMLEVAKAVYAGPRLLLLDEVTASMHHDRIKTLFSIIKSLRSEGVAIIYVTHRMNEIFEICDSVTVMRNGEVSHDGPLAGLALDDIVFHMTGQYPQHSGTSKPSDASQPSDSTGHDLANAEQTLRVEGLKIAPKVKDISLTALKGQIVGIGGLEGQGQPEFIRAVLGALKPDVGAFYYKGQRTMFSSAYEAVKNNMGFVSGDRAGEAIYASRTVSENIGAGLFTKGPLFRPLWPKTVNAHANKAVEDYKIVVGSIKHPASSLSGGNQQKLVLARWLSMKPDLLLLDDPTKGVDVHSRQEIHRLLRSAADDGMTVIISSSENEELLEISDCIYVFYEGVVAAVLGGAEKTAERLVAAMMGMSANADAANTVEAVNSSYS